MFVTDADFGRKPFDLAGLDKLSPGVFDDFVTFHTEQNWRELMGNVLYDALDDYLVNIPPVYDGTQSYKIGDKVVFVYKRIADVYTALVDMQKAVQPTGVTDVNWNKEPADKFVRLAYGDVYLYYGRPQKWYGLKYMQVPMIHSLWVQFGYDQQTDSGVVVANQENATVVSSSVRAQRSWNRYVELCAGDFPNTIDWQHMIWPELENSLFGYLYMNPDPWQVLVQNIQGFNDWRAYLAYSFGWPGYTNEFGI